jgi:periplasmic protein CpxP/Spy
MKRQILSFVAGAVLLIAPVLTQGVLTQGVQARQPDGNRMERMAQELNLTETQKAQIKTMKASHRTAMQNILTPEQQSKLKAAKEGQKGDRRGIMKSLNITDSQKAAMKSLRAQQRKDLEAILTPDQIKKLEQKKAEMKARWQQKRGSKGA